MSLTGVGCGAVLQLKLIYWDNCRPTFSGMHGKKQENVVSVTQCIIVWEELLPQYVTYSTTKVLPVFDD